MPAWSYKDTDVAILNDTMTELVAKRFRALGEPMRLRILQAL
jgi:DNA-binding transcriptional ArsR family regulator